MTGANPLPLFVNLPLTFDFFLTCTCFISESAKQTIKLNQSKFLVTFCSKLFYWRLSLKCAAIHRKPIIEAATIGVLQKELFLKIPQYSQENTILGVSFKKNFIKKDMNFIKKRHQHRCFPANIAKLLRTPILKNICERRLLLLLV